MQVVATFLTVLVSLSAVSTVPAAEKALDPVAVVRAREQAFAKTMADRDLAAFTSFIADDAVFLGGGEPLRGPKGVAEAWKGFFEGPKAPFSWEPESVAVLESGHLALSTGPVHAPDGKRVGTFTSTWRHDADGVWRIVLDSGCPPCACPPAAAADTK